MKIPREFRSLAKEARRQGWTISPTNGGHLVWLSPQGAKVHTSASPSDAKAVDNVARDLRQKGLRLP